MGFRDFTLQRVEQDFGLHVEPNHVLFGQIPPVAPSESVAKYLDLVRPLGLVMPTAKARSELLVAPLLADLWDRTRRQIGLFSGIDFDVDPAADLDGPCDFLVTRSPQLYYVDAPVLAVLEAERDSITAGLGPCAAAMVAAQRYNQQSGAEIETVFGCVTSGANWRFLALQDHTLAIDLGEFHISQPGAILGVLLEIVGAHTHA